MKFTLYIKNKNMKYMRYGIGGARYMYELICDYLKHSDAEEVEFKIKKVR